MPLPSPFQERLLPTRPDVLDDATADAIRNFCESSPEIETAYVCDAERRREGEKPERVLRLSVKLVRPVDTPDDTREPSLELVRRLSQMYPDVLRRLGYGVLADRAVQAWETHAVRVFTREVD
jgi:hypothetical protein